MNWVSCSLLNGKKKKKKEKRNYIWDFRRKEIKTGDRFIKRYKRIEFYLVDFYPLTSLSYRLNRNIFEYHFPNFYFNYLFSFNFIFIFNWLNKIKNKINKNKTWKVVQEALCLSLIENKALKFLVKLGPHHSMQCNVNIL